MAATDVAYRTSAALSSRRGRPVPSVAERLGHRQRRRAPAQNPPALPLFPRRCYDPSRAGGMAHLLRPAQPQVAQQPTQSSEGKRMGRLVSVAVPATSANMGPGFDSLGIALALTGRVTLKLLDAPAPPPSGPAEELALAAALHVYHEAGVTVPSRLQAQYDGDLPAGRGLGASAVVRV